MDINKENELGETPLFSACKSGKLLLVKCLVEVGADINKLNRSDQAPLFSACESGNLLLVKYLVEELGMDIHHEDCIGDFPVTKIQSEGKKRSKRIFI